jgi:hypothetical protein
MNFTFNERIVSDLYKDAYGFRPREYFWSEWNNSTDTEKQETWDQLLRELEFSINEEREREAAALARLEARIADTIAVGAADTVTALMWIMQAEEFSVYDLRYGADYFCYHFGVNYAAKDQLPIAEAIRELLAKETG